MGRAKVKMELIKSEKTRLTTFQNRKNNLIKKSRELSTLCDVQVGMIIYGPKAENPEIWPPNDESRIKRMIDLYQKQPPSDRKRRTVNLSDYFVERKKKIEDELRKVRQQNKDAKYPTWDDRYNALSEKELRMFANELDLKIEAAKARIAFLQGTEIGSTSTDIVVVSSTPTTQDVSLLVEAGKPNLASFKDKIIGSTSTNIVATMKLEAPLAITTMDANGLSSYGENTYYPNLLDPSLSLPLPFTNLDGSSSSSYYNQFSNAQFMGSFFHEQKPLSSVNGYQPDFVFDQGSRLHYDQANCNEPSGNNFVYLPMNGPFCYNPMMSGISPMPTLPMPPSAPVLLPLPMCHLAPPPWPMQLMMPPTKYVPNPSAAAGGSVQMNDSQSNGCCQLLEFPDGLDIIMHN